MIKTCMQSADKLKYRIDQLNRDVYLQLTSATK